MKRVVYILSDLHIGAEPDLDDFSSDDQFSEFLTKIDTDLQGSPAVLVLLGDTFDLWQIVPSQDKQAPSADKIDLDLSPAAECAKLLQAVDRHPRVFNSLKEFLQKDPASRGLVIVPGNHDHSLVEATVQQSLRNILGASQPPTASALSFCFSYDDPAMGLYAEHGNQYDRKNNAYSDFPQFRAKEECPGYYFVRLFWNRLEHLDPQLDNLYPDRWWEVFLWILRSRHFSLLGPALRYFHQYRSDTRVPKLIDVPGVPFFAAAPGEKVLPGMPERLLDRAALGPPYFSCDPATENEYLRLYRDDPEARTVIMPWLQNKFGIVPDLPPPSHAVPFTYAPSYFLGKNPYLDSVERMFASARNPVKPCFRATPLDPGAYRYVVLGHTHEDKREGIATVGGATYFNTGSWISRIDAAGSPVFRRYYLAIFQDASGSLSEKFEPF